MPKWPKTVKCNSSKVLLLCRGFIHEDNKLQNDSVSYIFIFYSWQTCFVRMKIATDKSMCIRSKITDSFMFHLHATKFQRWFFSGNESPACCLLVTEDWLYNWTSIYELLQLYIKKEQTKTWKTKLCLYAYKNTCFNSRLAVCFISEM